MFSTCLVSQFHLDIEGRVLTSSAPFVQVRHVKKSASADMLYIPPPITPIHCPISTSTITSHDRSSRTLPLYTASPSLTPLKPKQMGGRQNELWICHTRQIDRECFKMRVFLPVHELLNGKP
jgi:hypothetical protein